MHVSILDHSKDKDKDKGEGTIKGEPVPLPKNPSVYCIHRFLALLLSLSLSLAKLVMALCESKRQGCWPLARTILPQSLFRCDSFILNDASENISHLFYLDHSVRVLATIFKENSFH